MLKSIFLKKTFRTWQRENIVKIHFTSITGSRGITNFLGSISTFHSVELVPALLFAKAQYLPICLGPQFRNWSIQRRPCSSRSEKKIFTFFNAFVKYHNMYITKNNIIIYICFLTINKYSMCPQIGQGYLDVAAL